MKTECQHIADQIRRSIEGDAWHGPAVNELLSGISATQAAARPLKDVHSIWELVLHIEAWEHAPLEAIQGKPMPDPIDPAMDWPKVRATTEVAWKEAKTRLAETTASLCKAVEGLPSARLQGTVPGRKHNFHFLLDGVAQHNIYHAGQIAILKKSV